MRKRFLLSSCLLLESFNICIGFYCVRPAPAGRSQLYVTPPVLSNRADAQHRMYYDIINERKEIDTWGRVVGMVEFLFFHLFDFSRELGEEVEILIGPGTKTLLFCSAITPRSIFVPNSTRLMAEITVVFLSLIRTIQCKYWISLGEASRAGLWSRQNFLGIVCNRVQHYCGRAQIRSHPNYPVY